MVPQRWKRVAETARRQYGVISWEQLIAAGFTRHAVAAAVGAGHLLRLYRGVFALGHLPTDPRAHRLAATLVAGPDSWISHRDGAAHVRILPKPRGAIHLTVPTRGGRRPREGLAFHRAQLSPPERKTIERVRCTSVSRVLLDLAAERPGEIERAIKTAGDRELLSIQACLALLDRYPGRAGSPLLRRLLVGEDPVPAFTRSGLERRMFRLCRAAQLPLPDMNVDVAGLHEVHECDCGWPRHRLIIECDSRWHDNPIASVEDALKDQDLTLAGLRVHRLRWTQIVLEPALAAQTIQHLLDEQQRLLGVTA